MTQPQPDLHRRIANALARIEAVSRSEHQRAAQVAALSPLQVRVCVALQSRPGLRVGALARELLVTTGTVSAAVSVLEEKLLVTKQTDPEEHRAVVLVLTAKGRREVSKLSSWPDAVFEPIVSDLGEEAAAALLESLLRLLQAVERRGWIDPARMCFHCEYFSPWKGKGKRPHRCELLKVSIGGAELQVDCPDFEPVSPTVQETRWKELNRHA